jgi:hypothetical protein
VDRRTLRPPEARSSRAGAPAQLGAQMRRLEGDLRACDRHALAHAGPAELGAIEAVATPLRLVADHGQVRVEARQRAPAAAKALELGMAAVTTRGPAEHGAREKPLAPDGHEPGGIEVSWMQAPEAHRHQRNRHAGNGCHAGEDTP